MAEYLVVWISMEASLEFKQYEVTQVSALGWNKGHGGYQDKAEQERTKEKVGWSLLGR